jgi:uncharacterized protein (DUF58 family)
VRTREPEEFLSPEFLDGLDDLEWAARIVARGLTRGVHASALLGRGDEFDRHRAYQQGDDLRHLDWRLLARTDRLHVRRFRETSNLEVMFVVDASPSMDFAGEGGGITKLRCAVLIAAALGHVARGAGDLPGLVVTGGEGGEPATLLPARAGRERWRTYLHALQNTRPGAPASLARAVGVAADMLPRGGRTVILSDFLDEQDMPELVRSAAQLRAGGSEVTAIRVLTPEELGEAGGGDALWMDPERPDQAVAGAPDRDAGYLTRLRAYYADLAHRLEEHGVVWHAARTTDALLPLVRQWVREGAGTRPR